MSVIGLDPTSGPLSEAKGRPARRRASLDGVVLGLVSNGLGESDKVLAAVGEEIGRHVKLAGTVAVRKPSVSVPPDPIDWERLINSTTVAVAGFGGWGSCSARSLRDAVELEWAGIPSVAVVHHSMSGSAGAMARVSGMPDYPYLTVDYPHVPLAIWTPDEIAEVARELAPRIVELLSDDTGDTSPASAHFGGVMTDAPAALQPALDEVRSIISADGGDILLTSVEGSTVNLQLVVQGASCAECILPRELLEQVTLDIFQRGGTGVTTISIDDPRESPDFVASDH